MNRAFKLLAALATLVNAAAMMINWVCQEHIHFLLNYAGAAVAGYAWLVGREALK